MHPIIKKAQEILEARRPTLTCDMFNYTVEVAHEDGSHFIFHNADVKKRKVDNADMLLVWTEHRRKMLLQTFSKILDGF